MFKRALSAALLCAAFSAQADLVATNGANTLRLKQEPCTNEAILKTLRPEFHPQFKAGVGELNGKRFQACWIDTREGSYYVTFEDGDDLLDLLVPITVFVEVGI